jgi:hypothetical protein
MFPHYVDWLIEHYSGWIPRGRRRHLILDRYSVHRSDDIKRYAKRRGIQLWFIPGGFVDERQSLDRAVSGAIKAMFRRIFEEHLPRSPNERVRTVTVVQIVKEIWGQ